MATVDITAVRPNGNSTVTEPVAAERLPFVTHVLVGAHRRGEGVANRLSVRDLGHVRRPYPPD